MKATIKSEDNLLTEQNNLHIWSFNDTVRDIQPPTENTSESLTIKSPTVWTFDNTTRDIQPPTENTSELLTIKSSAEQNNVWSFDTSNILTLPDLLTSEHCTEAVEDIKIDKEFILPELRKEPFMDSTVHVNFSSKNLASYASSYYLLKDNNCYPEGNWVIPELFGIGACPYDPTIFESEKKSLITLTKIGFKHFCCLQKEYPSDLKVRSKIPPFYDEFEKSIYPNRVSLGLDENWTIPTVNIFPITDCEVESDDKIDAITDIYVQNIRAGEPCFVHCWGGHGRAGTFAAIVLIKLYKLKYDQVLKYMQAVHDCRITWIECTCPQMPTQYQQIKRFANKYST